MKKKSQGLNEVLLVRPKATFFHKEKVFMFIYKICCCCLCEVFVSFACIQHAFMPTPFVLNYLIVGGVFKKKIICSKTVAT